MLTSEAGRPIGELTSKVDYERLMSDCRKMIFVLVVAEREVHARDTTWFQVRLRPYPTPDDGIDGGVRARDSDYFVRGYKARVGRDDDAI